ncbi:hypothetical protein VTK56DRAFT_3816 [Thermocarpiscus australiensis]
MPDGSFDLHQPRRGDESEENGRDSANPLDRPAGPEQGKEAQGSHLPGLRILIHRYRRMGPRLRRVLEWKRPSGNTPSKESLPS